MQFKDKRMGKCRFGDHNERSRYGYRWQIRTDIEEPYVSKGKGHKQFFFPAAKLEDAAEKMIQYYNAIRRNNS